MFDKLKNLFRPNPQEVTTPEEPKEEIPVQTISEAPVAKEEPVTEEALVVEDVPEIKEVELKSPEEQAEALRRVLAEMREHSYNFAKTFPVWMKCNLISHAIGKLMEEGKTAEEAEKEIDWKKVNDFLKDSHVENDYNLFDEVDSIESLGLLRGDAIFASVVDDMPYHKKKCKQCGEDFYLTMGEIRWFEKKELHVPARCPYCRKGEKRPKPVKVEKKVEKPAVPEKTSMQIALEKAGITP